ncbi:uncharacterized protein LOC118562411 [Fundulus heteroclitus]|uniref:uncharacterized protein LOC118562411 n=1 Tax=Fundulus heteroclitus TaxID=8078 RepID=UPI00165C54B4|nr:uncharacterized protein LOC118562411 [Fundulus heteroclitus]
MRRGEIPLSATRGTPLFTLDLSSWEYVTLRAAALLINKRINRRYPQNYGGGGGEAEAAGQSVISGNVRSIANKSDELAALTRLQGRYRDASIMCFTETWLSENVRDSEINQTGFKLIRADINLAESGKKRGGGLAIFVNERWCNPAHAHKKQQICCPDVEILVTSLRPFYLPHEFSHVIALAVYIPPSADAAVACEKIHGVVNKLQIIHADRSFTLPPADNGGFQPRAPPLHPPHAHAVRHVLHKRNQDAGPLLC